jgi:hypothetical protein
MNGQRALSQIYELLGRVVLLPIPLGEKGPDFGAWQTLTYAQTKDPSQCYKRWIEERAADGGNIGVLLGPASQRLFALDIDDDELVREYLEQHP